MTDQSMQPDAEHTGSSDHPEDRTPAGEGSEAPLSQDQGGPAEISQFDGAGNEMTSVLTEDEQGMPRQGTGGDRESAIKDAKDPSEPISPGFTTGQPNE
ncbi:MAG: hypothetical protein M3396_03665 [Actinomycetota bacterium]|nr:hypothetical protein [Actinomycetota bacterium]MDQ3573943.1 hypothetical protein [Actinomycetota bacterium]